MKLIVIFFLSLTISSIGHVFETGRPFTRINNENNTLELAFRSYVNHEGQIIRLLSMLHIAQESFFAAVNELITDKVVLYELLGQTWEENCQQKMEIEQFGDGYYELCLGFDFYYRVARHHGLCYQANAVNYKLAKKIIHADVKNPVSTISKDQLHAYIVQQYMNLSEADRKATNINEMAQAVFRKISGEIPELGTLAFELIKLENSAENKEKNITQRNKIVEKKTVELLPNQDEINIVYGSFHFADFEKFLLREGFAPMNEGEKWIAAFAF